MTRPTAANCRVTATRYENVEGRSAARRARRDRYGAAFMFMYMLYRTCTLCTLYRHPTRTLLPLSPGSPAFLSPTRGRFEAAARKDSGGRGEARACRARERDVGGTVGERAFSLSNPPILIPNTLAALAFAHRQRRPCSTDTWWALRVAGG